MTSSVGQIQQQIANIQGGADCGPDLAPMEAGGLSPSVQDETFHFLQACPFVVGK